MLNILLNLYHQGITKLVTAVLNVHVNTTVDSAVVVTEQCLREKTSQAGGHEEMSSILADQ